jgi:hypothetical protein
MKVGFIIVLQDTIVKHEKRMKVEGSLLVSFPIIYGF